MNEELSNVFDYNGSDKNINNNHLSLRCVNALLNTNRNDEKRRWITEAENQINRIRQKISYITLMLDLHDKSNLTT